LWSRVHLNRGIGEVVGVPRHAAVVGEERQSAVPTPPIPPVGAVPAVRARFEPFGEKNGVAGAVGEGSRNACGCAAPLENLEVSGVTGAQEPAMGCTGN